MNAQPHFFQAFFGPQNTQMQQRIPEYIINNDIVLEIVNNWIYVKELIQKYKEGNLQQIDQLEQLWFNFITQNNIDISLYKNEEEFLNTFLKVPTN